MMTQRSGIGTIHTEDAVSLRTTFVSSRPCGVPVELPICLLGDCYSGVRGHCYLLYLRLLRPPAPAFTHSTMFISISPRAVERRAQKTRRQNIRHRPTAIVLRYPVRTTKSLPHLMYLVGRSPPHPHGYVLQHLLIRNSCKQRTVLSPPCWAHARPLQPIVSRLTVD